MQPSRNTKLTRFEVRITEEQKLLFQRAATLGGHSSLSDFVVSTVQERAKTLVQEGEVLDLSQRDKEIFFDAILNPKGPSDKLRQAAQEYIQVTSSRQ